MTDPDLTLELKSGDALDLEALDEAAVELFGLSPRKFVTELWTPEELHTVRGCPTLGAHIHDDGDDFSVIALDENLTGKEAAEVWAHEATHATHADLLFGDGKAVRGANSVYDQDTEWLAQAGAELHKQEVYERCVLDRARGGAARSSGGRPGVASPPAVEPSTPGPAEWPVPVRYNREGERDALRRLDE